MIFMNPFAPRVYGFGLCFWPVGVEVGLGKGAPD